MRHIAWSVCLGVVVYLTSGQMMMAFGVEDACLEGGGGDKPINFGSLSTPRKNVSFYTLLM